jgi:hypothetical protein
VIFDVLCILVSLRKVNHNYSVVVDILVNTLICFYVYDVDLVQKNILEDESRGNVWAFP